MPVSPILVSIVIPTYNERPNIPTLVSGIDHVLKGDWEYELIVVDDSSPDGTSEEVLRLAADDAHIRLVQRPGKMGLGSAVVDGFKEARGEYWVMMDADLSHRPADLPALLKALAEADIVVGSRYVHGGGVSNWSLLRRLGSRGASALGRAVVGLDTRDVTSGFAAFRKECIEPILPSLKPRGFKFLIEVLAEARGNVVKEVPILFMNRRYGKSKLTPGEVFTFLRQCLGLRRGRTMRGGAQGR